MKIDTPHKFTEWLATIPEADIQNWDCSIETPLVEAMPGPQQMHRRLERQRTQWKATGELVEFGTITFTCQVRLHDNEPGGPDHDQAMTDDQLTEFKALLDRPLAAGHKDAVSNGLWFSVVSVLTSEVTRCHARIRDLEAEESRNHDRITVMIVELERWRERVRELVGLDLRATASANTPKISLDSGGGISDTVVVTTERKALNE